MSERVDHGVLSGYGCIGKMDEEHLTKWVWKDEVSEVRVRRNPRNGWMEWAEKSTGNDRFVSRAGREESK